MRWIIYVLQVSDGSYYTGITNNLWKRLLEHKKKKGSKYVASRLPFVLVYTEEVETKSEALKREAEVKGLNHAEKAMLINRSKDDEDKVE